MNQIRIAELDDDFSDSDDLVFKVQLTQLEPKPHFDIKQWATAIPPGPPLNYPPPPTKYPTSIRPPSLCISSPSPSTSSYFPMPSSPTTPIDIPSPSLSFSDTSTSASQSTIPTPATTHRDSNKQPWWYIEADRHLSKPGASSSSSSSESPSPYTSRSSSACGLSILPNRYASQYSSRHGGTDPLGSSRAYRHYQHTQQQPGVLHHAMEQRKKQEQRAPESRPPVHIPPRERERGRGRRSAH